MYDLFLYCGSIVGMDEWVLCLNVGLMMAMKYEKLIYTMCSKLW